MSFTQIFQSLVGGLLIGGVYSLVAIGLTIIYGVLKIVNFAHGDFSCSPCIWLFFHIHFLTLIPTSMVFLALPLFFLFGVFIYKLIIQPIVEKGEEHIQILLTMGLAWVLQKRSCIFLGRIIGR